jgi:aldose 1-epimerase
VSRGGEEHRITHGGYAAVVTAVGGGLRLLRHEDRDLIRPYEAGEVRPRFRGSLLAPWPNRVVDGRYTFDGATYQLDITEPERGHALHGLVCWSRFDLEDRRPSSVTAAHRIVPRTGYPFEVEVRAHYELDEHGLVCTVTAANRGDGPAPFGVGSHPYLLGGPGTVDSWTLEVPVTRVLEVTEGRLVPRGLADVAGGAFDFAVDRSLEGLEVDHAFTGLRSDADGLARARVRGPDGSGVMCTWDPVALPWVQVHTADLAPPEPSRAGLALEPMSCPPDAFNSGVDLRVLAPGGSREDWWRIGAL